MAKIKRKEWLRLIDTFMGIHKRPSLSWEAIVALEGGYGKDKIRSVEEAMALCNVGTWPGIWFQSGQTDLSVYARYDYIYSLLFGRLISGNTISLIAAALEERCHKEEWDAPCRIIDWGGSIFTAVDLLDLTTVTDSVIVINIPSPQSEFGQWAAERLGLENHIKFVDRGSWSAIFASCLNYPGSLITILSEVLEHIKQPIKYFQDLTERFDLHDLYIASSFCTPAYGHHIPIRIGEFECQTPRQANKYFRKYMESFGYKLTKLEGWNSRVWWVRKEI